MREPVADGDDPVLGHHQIGIHHVIQPSDDDVADLGAQGSFAFFIEIDNGGTIHTGYSAAEIAQPIYNQRWDGTLLLVYFFLMCHVHIKYLSKK